MAISLLLLFLTTNNNTRGNVIDFDIFQHKKERNHLLVDRVMFLWNWWWISRCGHPLQLKLLTDQDTWDACVGAGIFCFNFSPSLVWPFSAPICRLFIGFFLPLLAFPGHHGQPRPLLSDCGSRPSQWFHQPILHIHHSFTGGEDKGRGRRKMILAAVMLLEMLVTRGTSQKSSWRTGRLLWRLRKTICEEPLRFSAQYVLQKF